jgi:hypothetical protein
MKRHPLEEEDKRMRQFLREKYGLDSDASVVRYLVRRNAKEGVDVSGEKSRNRENRTTR